MYMYIYVCIYTCIYIYSTLRCPASCSDPLTCIVVLRAIDSLCELHRDLACDRFPV